MAFILRSADCNMFMPLPLCPTTRNLGILNDARPTSRPVGHPNRSKFFVSIKSQMETNQVRLIEKSYLLASCSNRVQRMHFPAPGPD